MLKNYFKIAFRKLSRNKLDAFISIGGLSVGIACCILLVAFVHFEWTHDNFHQNSDRIYRVIQETLPRPDATEKQAMALTPIPLADALQTNYPEIEEIVRIGIDQMDVEIGGKFQFEEVYKVDSGFFDIFSFLLISGNPQTVLENPNSIVITRQKAIQIFGSEQVVGETLTARSQGEVQDFTVMGVAENPPENSSITFKYLLPRNNNLLSVSENQRDNWHIWSVDTFILLHENAGNREQLEEKFPSLLTSYYSERQLEMRDLELKLQPLNEIYLSSEIRSNITETSNPLYSWILTCIALVVLGIAGINFMSLTLSRATARSNEIGIRKVVGAGRRELRRQFLGEAFITCLMAFVVGGVLAELLLPWFRSLVGKPLTFELMNDPILWLGMVALLLIATLITGGYPAWVLARKKITTAFVSRTTSGRVPAFVKGLIVVQFALAITLLSSAFIMYNQMNFISTTDLGFEPEDILEIELSSTNPQKGGEMFDTYSQEALQISGVESVTALYRSYGGPSFVTYIDAEELSTELQVQIVDEHFLETMEIDLVAGRFFSPDRRADFGEAMLVNRTAAEEWDWENPVGQRFPESSQSADTDGKEIIGVVDDYHYRNLFNQVEPLVFLHRQTNDGQARVMRVKLTGGALSHTVDQLRNLWDELFPEETFNYSYLDGIVDQHYASQHQWRNIVEFASGIAFLLACFGLFGLAALSAQRRTKEIGIRKVLGATISSIVGLLTKDFLKLVLLGFVIAVPIAWYVMNRWLQDFAYRIEIGFGIFAIAGGIALAIAILTVSWQSVRAALANPVESIRNE